MDKRGFTLIEVITAVAILSIAMVLIVSLFSGGLSSVRVVGSYSSALMLAREKIEEAFSAGANINTEEVERGKFKKFRWERTFEPFYISDVVEKEPSLYMVRVRVAWRDGTKNKEISLEGVIPPLLEKGSPGDAI